MAEPVFVGMPATDRVFAVAPWGKIRCGGPCRDDYERIVRFQSRAGQIVTLQHAAAQSFQAAEKALGFGLLLTGSIRTCERQAELYASDPKRFAHPAKTAHTRGLAIDVSTAQSSWRKWRIKRALSKRGWFQCRPIDEPWHWSFGIQV
jgi:hypothetical protein